jgi:dolichol-phosphate mannosyltransferase
VREIVLIDGGSTDGTQALIRKRADGDARIRFVDAAPVPDGVNGKAYGLMVGIASTATDTDWLLIVDADVRIRAGAVNAIVGHAERSGLKALSVATTQRIHGSSLGLLHPAMLATLVYRFGIPGGATDRIDEVQANGQCFLVQRALLERAGGFQSVLRSIAEDVTLARSFVELGEPVGFFESRDLVEVVMYSNGRDAWRNWPRSLPLRDRHATWQSDVGLAEVLFVQAAPPVLLIGNVYLFGARSLVSQLQVGLIFARVGVLAGMRRAYFSRPWTYWLSPLADLPVTLEILRRSRLKSHMWRGRTINIGDAS